MDFNELVSIGKWVAGAAFTLGSTLVIVCDYMATQLTPPVQPASGIYPIVYAFVNAVAFNWGQAKNANKPLDAAVQPSPMAYPTPPTQQAPYAATRMPGKNDPRPTPPAPTSPAA